MARTTWNGQFPPKPDPPPAPPRRQPELPALTCRYCGSFFALGIISNCVNCGAPLRPAAAARQTWEEQKRILFAYADSLASVSACWHREAK